MRRTLPAFALVLAALAVALPAAARDRPGLTFDLGIGASVQPDYPGASSYRVGPTGSFGFRELVLPGGFGLGTASTRPVEPGFGPRGALRYMRARKASDHPELAGLDAVKASLELGLGLVWVTEHFRAFAETRYGVIGHGGWAGDLGADLIWRHGERTVLHLGPRAAFGDGRFTRTYFGVTPDEAAASALAGTGLAAFRPRSGLVSVGLELGLHHAFGSAWGLEGAISWNRLQRDAALSPITAQGARDQWGVRLILTRRFTFGR